MKKIRTTYVCQSCAYASARWIGKCPSCGEWNTFVEELTGVKTRSRKSSTIPAELQPVSLEGVSVTEENRLVTGIQELDRVLGGGIVKGSVVLVGGDPGIGKSTLMLQMAASLSTRVLLYITGEESVNQLKLRANRLERQPSRNLLVLAETNLELVHAVLEKTEPDALIVDSIQTMFRPDLESAPGTVSQVREGTASFLRFAKTREIPVFLVGHVTKEGVIAGPKVVEHMVDTVLQFEGERHYAYRVLRAVKNRFGSTNEIGIFEMHDRGLREVHNPSEVFLSERKEGTTGSSVVASMEGTRPLLLEVQALVAPTGYGVPQRTTTGFDSKRLQMLLAVLEKRLGLRVGQFDVFVNVVGGVRVDEPAVDLGMAVSIVSSLREVAVDPSSVAIGEIGLGGEIRTINQIERRVGEAQKLGFKRIVLPRNNLKPLQARPGVRLVGVESVEQAIQALLPQA